MVVLQHLYKKVKEEAGVDLEVAVKNKLFDYECK